MSQIFLGPGPQQAEFDALANRMGTTSMPSGNGTNGQLLSTNGDGTTAWTSQGTPTDSQVETQVTAWLTAHPEATTTVEDGAISRAKLDSDLKEKTDEVPNLKSAVEEETGNLFYLSKSNPDDFFNGTGVNGVKLTKYQDGSIEIHGTTTGSTTLFLNEATGTNTAWLAAGTYSFGLEILSGSVYQEKNAAISIRSVSSSNVVLNYSTRSATATYENAVLCYLNFASGYTYTHFRFRVTINKGSTLMDYAPNKTGYDFIARKKATRMESLKYLFSMPEIPVQIYNYTNKCQGGTMIGDVFVYFRNNSSGTVGWRAFNIVDGSEYYGTVAPPSGVSKATDVLGHCNDVAYNPVTGKLYMATVLDAAPIAELSVTFTNGAPSFEFVQNIVSVDGQGGTVVAAGVAYDRAHDCYYILQHNSGTTGGNIYKYDNTWGYDSVIEVDSSVVQAIRQGMDTDGTYVYFCRSDNSNGSLVPCVQIYAIADGALVGERRLYMLRDQEIEGVGYDWTRNIFVANTNIKSPYPNATRVYVVDPDGTAAHIASKIAYLMK